MVVAVTETGEEAFDDAFESRHALGQGLDVLLHVGQAVADFDQASIEFRAQTLVIGAEFGSQGLRIGTKGLGFRRGRRAGT